MDITVKNLLDIENKIKSHLSGININNIPKIIAVSKTFNIDKISPLIEHGHVDFGENKVQEAVEKWSEIKNENSKIKLHMIGKLQTNKVKFAVQIFDYIHSVDSEKLAKKIADEQSKINKKIKIFLQVNIGDETQKSGINKNELNKLKKAINLANKLGIEVHAGHGLTFKSSKILSKIKGIKEFNIGHFLVGESIFIGLPNVIKKFKKILKR